MYLADVASLDFNDDSLSGADTHAINYCEENIGWSCVTGQLKWQTHPSYPCCWVLTNV